MKLPEVEYQPIYLFIYLFLANTSLLLVNDENYGRTSSSHKNKFFKFNQKN